MKFWDSSAVIPLILKEAASEKIKLVVKEDEDQVVWWATRVECLSALARRRREGKLSVEAEGLAKGLLLALVKGWSEVLPGELVRQRTERLLAVHPLRAAAAFQLAAALIWAEEKPQGLEIVCLVQNLREAALKEGLEVLP
ncbi:MAG: PIN domain-containing protein [Deltaproteobacteria bacterium]|nr:PIN domain-containing protein [Deltaproteobacteria bacterium]